MIDQSSSTPVSASNLPGQGLNIAFTVLSFLGAAVAGTLWWAHRNNIALPCTDQGSCELDWDSRFAHVDLIIWHNVPVALLGLIAYVVLMTIGMAKYSAEGLLVRRMLSACGAVIAALGFGYSWYLQYAAWFVVGAFCPWCFSSAVIISAIFVVSAIELSKLRRAVASDASAR